MKKQEHKSKFALTILLLFNLVSCAVLLEEEPLVDFSPSATVKIVESPTAVEELYWELNWVVITKDEAEQMGIATWLVESDGFWTPSSEDIWRLEDQIAEYLSQNADAFYRQPPVWQRLDEYQRQYIGLERGGRRLIYGNFFCNNMDLNWLQDLVVVEDGGECYFQVEYDLESEVFTMLMVNGES